MPYIGKQLVRGQNRKLDDISSGFNGSQTTFTLQVASQNVTVGSALQLWISLGGVIQDPLSDYTIAGNQITFTTAPAASLDFFGVIQGDVTDTNTPGDATVTTSKLSTGLTVNLADGSAATSSLQLGGTDSGLFSSAADKVNVTTGGVERLEIGDSEVVFNDPSNDVDFRVESNGNANMLFVDGGNDRVGVGIGTPTSVLDVRDTQTGAASEIKLFNLDQGNTTTQTSALVMTPDVRANGAKIAVVKEIADFSSTANRDLAITFSPVVNNTATEKMRIDSSGNVGIGTTSPGAKLSIAEQTYIDGGFIRFLSNASSQTGTAMWRPATDTLAFNTNSTERMRIDSSGNVGIGTTAPNRVLEIKNAAPIIRLTESAGTYSEISGSTSVLSLRADEGAGVSNTRIDFRVDGSEKMRIDSSGNVGIGATSPAAKLDVAGNQLFSAANPQIQFNAGGPIIRLPSANTLAFLTDSTNERMRIDSSGRMLVGTSSARANFLNGSVTGLSQVEGSGSGSSRGLFSVINNATAEYPATLLLGRSNADTVGSNTLVGNGDWCGRLGFMGNDGSEFVELASISGVVHGSTGANDMPGLLSFRTTADGGSSPTQRMTIDSAGALTTDNSAYAFLRSDSTTTSSLTLRKDASGADGVDYLQCRNTANSLKLVIEGDGDVKNVNNSYGSTSDSKLKENIVDAFSQWSDIKNLQVRNYNFTEASGYPTHTQIGLVAQEVETVSPGLVSESIDRDEESNDLGTTTKSVKYSVLYMKAVKALQEAMDRIETLEAKVAALEAE